MFCHILSCVCFYCKLLLQPAGLLMFLESEDTVPETDVEEDKLNFRDNLKFAIQHSNKTRKNVIEKHLQVGY